MTRKAKGPPPRCPNDRARLRVTRTPVATWHACARCGYVYRERLAPLPDPRAACARCFDALPPPATHCARCAGIVGAAVVRVELPACVVVAWHG